MADIIPFRRPAGAQPTEPRPMDLEDMARRLLDLPKAKRSAANDDWNPQ
jgi:hypothetical protein